MSLRVALSRAYRLWRSESRLESYLAVLVLGAVALPFIRAWLAMRRSRRGTRM